MALDTTTNDMDIDMDFDDSEDPEMIRLRAEAAELDARAEAVRAEAMNGVEEAPEEGEIDSNAAAPNKVHIRGLDRFNTFDIERYAGEHYSMDLYQKVQWIDDTSANIIYDTPTAAAEALLAFSAEEVSEPLQLRAAKTLSTHPDVELQGGIQTTQTTCGQELRDEDPDDGYGHNKSRRREYESDRRIKRGSRDQQPQFHEDMYGDDPQAAADSRRNSYSSSSEYGRSRRNRNDDLFANRQDGRLRNRSASPVRDEDGRYGFEDTQPHRQTARARSRTPPGIRRNRDNRVARENLRKELFPNRTGSSALSNGHSTTNSRPASSNSNRELFPEKLSRSGSVHRRQEAKHIDPEEVAHAIGRRPEQTNRSNNGGDLFSRISGGPKAESSYGRLTDEPSGGFSIKGAGDAGFSILGASKERVQSPLVKELFPKKVGGGGQDLFDGRIRGRAARMRAEDYL